ncbi:unnamed protein product [Zymoseptoria tritici ST99CH_1A5]|uniref:Uncharacterized protein n=3 Tax=Zymoseptoria tritici TaxID=1047171 RepID=F9XJ82_ZYMTI|nr:uncharacterized protein MYCGRDRAFT_105677 [Zymoseptoria tritici IPO323]EGP84301.1 hypothetical protein MYCGRDRAFT_105677 [Zymoseptoria tritici IPO323]SMQ53910.1 unnamed protein product [Zymoseptoria tritici ST99CH_3D7]SMR61326.1 unnamed protein product [Zymoseptoria tritici ST99CH_3D1]SMY27547.1 unnamed protein product [Zymoseptoria tritici ST99CH_1A5]
MKSACAILFAAVAAALPSPVPNNNVLQGTPENPLKFSGQALRASSPIHFGTVNANGKAFWIGKDAKTYNPLNNNTCVVDTNTTTFSYINGQGQVSLYTNVPGGQQVYVKDDGSLRFTGPHSVATDGNATFTGFGIAYDAKLQFENQDWLACLGGSISPANFQIYAASRIPAAQIPKDCLGFTWHDVYHQNATAAWQYE